MWGGCHVSEVGRRRSMCRRARARVGDTADRGIVDGPRYATWRGIRSCGSAVNIAEIGGDPEFTRRALCRGFCRHRLRRLRGNHHACLTRLTRVTHDVDRDRIVAPSDARGPRRWKTPLLRARCPPAPMPTCFPTRAGRPAPRGRAGRPWAAASRAARHPSPGARRRFGPRDNGRAGPANCPDTYGPYASVGSYSSPGVFLRTGRHPLQGRGKARLSVGGPSLK